MSCSILEAPIASHGVLWATHVGSVTRIYAMLRHIRWRVLHDDDIFKTQRSYVFQWHPDVLEEHLSWMTFAWDTLVSWDLVVSSCNFGLIRSPLTHVIFFGSILAIDIKLYSISVMELAIATRLYFRSHRSMRRWFCTLQRPYESCTLCGSCVMFPRILFVFKRSPRDILTSKDTANRLMSSLCYFKRLDFLILLSERLELFDLNWRRLLLRWPRFYANHFGDVDTSRSCSSLSSSCVLSICWLWFFSVVMNTNFWFWQSRLLLETLTDWESMTTSLMTISCVDSPDTSQMLITDPSDRRIVWQCPTAVPSGRT